MYQRTFLYCVITGLLIMCAPPLALAQEPQADDVLSDLKLPKLRRNPVPRVTEEAEFKLIKGDGRLYFSLISGDDVLLRSPGYATERAARDAMERVVKHVKRARDMPMRMLESGEHYFVVITGRDDVLASSPLYSSREEARAMRVRLKNVSIALTVEE